MSELTKVKYIGSPISRSNLSIALGIDDIDLDYLLVLDDEAKYKSTQLIKNDGRIRNINNPSPIVRKIQRKIKNRIFNLLKWPIYLYGSIPKQDNNSHDFIECATQHCGAKSLLKLDIEDFFDNISEGLVKKFFQDVMYFELSTEETLAKICCLDGKVPQGGITSSYLASLALYSVEEQLYFRLKNKKLIYTRYVDDITISSKDINYNFDMIVKIIEKELNSLDLPLNRPKIQVSRFGLEPLKVHNVIVDSKVPRYDQAEVKRIKAMVHRLELLVQKPNYRTHYFYRQDYNSCMGFVNKLGRVNHPSYMKLKNRLKKIYPLPNKADLAYISEALLNLEAITLTSKNTFIYQKKFFKIQHRIALLKSHPKNIYLQEAIVFNTKLQSFRLNEDMQKNRLSNEN